MERERGANSQQLAAVIGALVAGSVIGWLDLSATDVQGPLLLIMLGAFILGMSGRLAPWLAGILIGVGVVGAHLVAWAVGAASDAGFGSIISVVPAIGAAYAGRFMGALVGLAADSLPYGRVTTERQPSEPDLPWYAERGASRGLLAAILCGSAVIGLPVVYHGLLAAGQPITWWVAIIWQIVTLIGWIVLTPVVIDREGKSDAVTATSIATTLAQIAGLALAHVILLMVVTRVLLIPPGNQEMLARIGHAFAAYLPLDIVTFVLLWTLAYVSNADRHLRGAARLSAAKAALLSAELNAGKLSALRAQLQPHFLFNAINTAVVLSSKGNAAEATGVLTSLADLLRYVLSDKADVVKLGDELDFVEKYLVVERARFPDRLSFEIDADAGARESLVPHLLLQPLVENAVRHGIAEKISPSKVVVTARIEGEKLLVTIQDNGIGIDRAVASDGGGVGIANTRSRLSLMYGEDATLEVTPGTTGGTICHITIPQRLKQSSLTMNLSRAKDCEDS
jgi:two-component system LytT family sensor kinase